MYKLRYLTSFIFAGLVSLSFFFVMQQMTSFSGGAKKNIPETQNIDFVRLIREPQIKKKKRELPKKPPPPKKKPPPPKLSPIETTKPNSPNLDMSAPSFNIPLDLKGSLLTGIDANAANTALRANDEVIPLVRIAPRYPQKAARSGIEGWVKLEIQITEAGTVENARVIDAEPKRIFNRAAKQAIIKWKFKPKLVDGKAVSRTATQIIEFNLDGQ